MVRQCQSFMQGNAHLDLAAVADAKPVVKRAYICGRSFRLIEYTNINLFRASQQSMRCAANYPELLSESSGLSKRTVDCRGAAAWVEPGFEYGKVVRH